MKKNIKFVALFYIGVAIFTYALTLRVDNLESNSDYQNKNEMIVFRIK